MFKKSVASKEQVKLMLALTGPSGSGKTLSALKLAIGLTNGDWSKITLADTENRSSLYYAGEKTGAWEFIDFASTIPGAYHPHNWVKLIEYVESDPKTEVLILDSISHEWDALGGALDLNQKFGGKFSDWAKVNPIHNAFIDKMRQSRLHIIATMRSKQDYVVELNDKGKSAPRKVGTRSVQREGTDYEFGVMFDIEMNHYANSSKDRTGLFAPRGSFIITPETGQELLAWCKEGDVTENTPKPVEIFSSKNEAHLERLLVWIKKKDPSMALDEQKIFIDLMEGKPTFMPVLKTTYEEIKAKKIEG